MASSTDMLLQEPVMEPGESLHDIDLTLQRFRALTRALDVRLQQRHNAERAAANNLGQQLLDVASQAGPSSTAAAGTHSTPTLLGVRTHTILSEGAAAPTQQDAYEPKGVVGHASSTEEAGHMMSFESSSSSSTISSAYQECDNTWRTNDGSCPLNCYDSLLQPAKEPPADCSLPEEALAAADELKQAHTADMPAWRHQLQNEQELQLAQQRHHAESAAVSRTQVQAIRQAASWDMAKHKLDFKPTSCSKVSGARHGLQRSLSRMLRHAAEQTPGQPTDRQHTAPAAVAQPVEHEADSLRDRAQQTPIGAAAAARVASASQSTGTLSKHHTVVPLMDRYISTAASHAAEAIQLKPQSPAMLKIGALEPNVASSLPGTWTSGPGNCGGNGAVCSIGAAPPTEQFHSSADFIEGLRIAIAGDTAQRWNSSKKGTPRAEEWAAADAATDAELLCYLRDHWQQHNLPAAALILQCAWRSRGPRIQLNRYMSVRRRNAVSTLGPPLLDWHKWTQAGIHCWSRVQRHAFQAWRELVVLQLEFCSKVVRGLQHGVLSGEVPSLLTWRMCTPVDTEHSAGVQPSLGGLLANLLIQRETRFRLRACFRSWLTHLQELQATRGRVSSLLGAVTLRWCKQSAKSCLCFWHLYTVTVTCERLAIALPLLRPRLPEYEGWLWHHERAKQLKHQAAALFDRSCLKLSFGGWRGHAHKVQTMHLAWTGLVLVAPAELIRHGMSAFKANWKEQRVQRELLRVCCSCWLEVSRRNKTVAVMRHRIHQASEHQCKHAAIQAFKRYTNTSLLMTTAAILKLWQARPLLLGHLHAWMNDSLHMTVYLLWWRWRRRAVARLRFRAALGLHMYRAHWVGLELAFIAWRKVTAMAMRSKRAPTEQNPMHQETGAAASVVSSERDISGGIEPVAKGDQADEEQQGGSVFVCLADSPTGLPWRPLAQRSGVLARRGLQRVSGTRLGKAVRDLRELEGMYIIKDHDRGAEGLLGGMVYNKRKEVSPGLKAMVTAELPMTALWQAACLQDSLWWQRVVGLMQQRSQHPDSWRCFITSYKHTKCSSFNSDTTTVDGKPLPWELHDFLHGCCFRVQQGTETPNSSSSCLVQSTSPRSGLAKMSGFIQPLHLARDPSEPEFTRSLNTLANSKQAAGPLGSSIPAVGTDCKVHIVTSSNQGATDTLGVDSSEASAGQSGCDWLTQWSCEDVAWLCQLVQAEELLETVVHMLLGIGADTTEELYQKLAVMTQGQGLDMQGDLLAWLLSTAMAHDTAHARGVLLKARARDDLVVATMEMRQRAVALHLHFPWKFTLNQRGSVTDTRALWTEVVRKVEAEQDWDGSSVDSDNGPAGEWTAVLLQQPGSDHTAKAAVLPACIIEGGQAPTSTHMQSVDGMSFCHGRTTGSGEATGVNDRAAATPSRPQSPFFLTSAQDSSRPGRAAAVEGRNSLRPQSLLGDVPPAAAVAAAIAVATASSGGAGTRSSFLSPGGVLSQTIASNEVQTYVASRASTPADAQQRQQHLEAEIQMQEEATKAHRLRRKQKAQQKQKHKQQAAMDATKGLFAQYQAIAPVTAAAGAADSISITEGDAFCAQGEVFLMPAYAGIAGTHSAGHSGASSRVGTPRVACVSSARMTGSGSEPEAPVDASNGSMPGLCQVCIPAIALQQQGGAVQQNLQAQQGESMDTMQQPETRASASSRAVPGTVGTVTANFCSNSRRAFEIKPISSNAPPDSSREPIDGKHRPVKSTHDIGRPASSNSTGQEVEFELPHQRHVDMDDPNSGRHASCVPNRPSDGASNSSDIREGLKDMLATVLAPTNLDDVGAYEIRQAADGLAEACAQWVVEHSWQIHQPVGMCEQQQQVKHPQDTWGHRNATAGDAADNAGVVATHACLTVGMQTANSHGYILYSGSKVGLAAAGNGQYFDASPGKQLCSGVNCIHQVDGVNNLSVLPANDTSAVGNAAEGHDKHRGLSVVVQPAVTAKQGHGCVQEGDSHWSGSLLRAISGDNSLPATTSREVNSNGEVLDLLKNAPAKVPAEALSAAYVTGLTSDAAGPITPWHAAVTGASAAAAGGSCSRPGQTAESTPADQAGRAADKVSDKALQSWTSKQRPQIPPLSLTPHPCSIQHPNQQQLVLQPALQKEVSSCSSTSSLPSIPSCGEWLQQVMQQAKRSTKAATRGLQLPSIVHSLSGTPQSPQSRPQGTGDLDQVHKDVLCEAACKTPVFRECQQSASQSSGGGYALAAHTLDSPLGDDTKKAEQQFECSAQQLEPCLTAALLAQHAASGTAADASASAPAADHTAGQSVQQLGQQVGMQVGMQSPSPVEAYERQGEPDLPAVFWSDDYSDPLDDAGGTALGAGVGVRQADMTRMVSKLMKAPLTARFVFWRQVAQQQLQEVVCSSTSPLLASQLHRLAWSGLLQRPAVRPQPQSQQVAVPAAVSATASIASRPVHLHEKLQQYMRAHEQWRAQVASAAPLTPAEKWASLEHEEQVLDFLTSLTISVYVELLHKRTGVPLPTVAPQLDPKSQQVLGFGSSSTRCGNTRQSIMPSGTVMAVMGPATADNPSQAIQVEGEPVALTKPASSTQPRQRLQKPAPVFVIPAPAVLSEQECPHAGNRSRQMSLLRD